MGKVIGDNVTSDSSDDERRKTVREEQKVRTKKKKRKRDLTDLHHRLLKSKKNKDTKITGKLAKARNSKRICNRILPRPLSGIYRNGAVGKEIRRSQTNLSLNDTNHARLRGNVLKLLQGYDSKSENIIIENNIEEGANEVILDSTVKNILHPTISGVTCISPVLGKVDGKKRCQKDECARNIGPSKFIGLLQKSPEKKKPVNFAGFHRSAIRRYEEFCTTISSDNFQKHNSLDQLTTDPLINVKKKLRDMYAESFRNQVLQDIIKHSTALKERETPGFLSENGLSSEIVHCPSTFGQHAEHQIHCRINEGRNSLQETQSSFLTTEPSFNLNGKRNQIPTSHLLFDLSLLNESNNFTGVENIVESEQIRKMSNIICDDDDLTDINKHISSSVDMNHSAASTHRNKDNIGYFKDPIPAYVNRTDKIKEGNKSIFLLPNTVELPNDFVAKKHLIKRKNQRTQTTHLLNTAMKNHSGKHNLKTSQQIKTKSLKHVPAILRRCSNTVTNNDQMNLFSESININEKPRETLLQPTLKQNILFTPQFLKTELNGNTKESEASSTISTIFDNTNIKDTDVQTCVIASPSLRNNEVCFIKNSCPQVVSKQQSQNTKVNNIFSYNNKKAINSSIQKTVMFTKKDSRNIGHCLRVNSLISDGTADSSNVFLMRKNVPQQREKSIKNTCAAHRDCQRMSANCYRSFRCSQNSDNSNHNSQEFKEPCTSHFQTIQVQEEPIAYEKVLLRKVQRDPKYETSQKCCNKDKRVCYVVVDRCKDLNSAANCPVDNRSSKIENPRILQSGHCCQEDVADVSILKGVQNLQILPVDERESQVRFTSNQCIGNTVVLEEQPTKYLAFENDSKTQRIPIYVQKNQHVAPVDNIELINPKVNYQIVSCPKESTQKVILVPTQEQNKVVYVKQQNLDHSNILYPRKVVLYRQEHESNTQCVKDPPNRCEVHAPKQNLMGIRDTECERVAINLQEADNVKQLKRDNVNWKELYYRPTHGKTYLLCHNFL